VADTARVAALTIFDAAEDGARIRLRMLDETRHANNSRRGYAGAAGRAAPAAHVQGDNRVTRAGRSAAALDCIAMRRHNTRK